MAFAPIAIVGRACLLPGAHSPEDLWEAVQAGRNLIGVAPADRWRVPSKDILGRPPEGQDSPAADRAWSDRGGYIRGFSEHFNPEGFEVRAGVIRRMDPLVQWSLHTARQALSQVRSRPSAPRMGLVMGNLSFPSSGLSSFAEQKWLEEAATVDARAQAELNLGQGSPADRFMSGLPALTVARALGMEGRAMALDAACASSLVAIKYAIDHLQDGRADLMLAGAVNRADDLFIHVGFCALKALSKTGQSRPFHAQADGLIPAEGAGFVALKRLDDALRDGDEIYGIIRGLGLSNDGRGRGLLAPSTEGQVRAIRQAMEQSGLDATDLSLVECHATGTPVGDATEIQSMLEAYGPALGARSEPLPIGSLKSNMGHLITAAGIAGLIKVLEAMRHGIRPPSLHMDQPHPILSGARVRVVTQAEPWETVDSQPRRAAVSAFGFGGNNAHLIVEQASLSLDTEEPATIGAPSGAIAVVGMGMVVGEAEDRRSFEEAVFDGPGLVRGGEARIDRVGISLGGLRFPPNDLRQALGQQTTLLKAAREALHETDGLPRDTTGIFIGMGADPEVARYGARWRLADWARRWGADEDWLTKARDGVLPSLEAAGVLGSMPNIPANRLNSQFDLAGPSCTVSAEEASGLCALELAKRGLRIGELDAALVGAVDLSCEPVHRAAAAALLPDDRQIPGDAAVVLVLKRLTDASASRRGPEPLGCAGLRAGCCGDRAGRYSGSSACCEWAAAPRHHDPLSSSSTSAIGSSLALIGCAPGRAASRGYDGSPASPSGG
jgi:acyl transferase domain-containing protein